MRTFFPIAFVLYISSLVQAQDTLYRMNGTLQVVNVLELKENAIRYSGFHSSDSTVYNLSTSALSKIAFRDGTVKTFFQTSLATLKKENKVDSRAADFGRNFIALNVFDLTRDNLTFSFEHTFKSGACSIKIPFSIGLSEKDTMTNRYDRPSIDYYSNNKIFSTGIDLYFYPYGQGFQKFFFGPSVEYGIVDFNLYFSNFWETQNISVKSSYYALLFQSGILIQPFKHINLAFHGGFGVSKFDLDPPYERYYSKIHMTFRLGVLVGYKF